LIRAHETVQGGHVIHPSFEGKLVTLFSSLAGAYARGVKTPGYCLLGLAKEINSWEEKYFGSVSVEKTETEELEADLDLKVPDEELLIEKTSSVETPQPKKTEGPSGGLSTEETSVELSASEAPPEAPPEGPPSEETGQPPERQEGELLAVESSEGPPPEEPLEELIAIEEEAKGKKEQEEAQRQTKEAKLSRGFSFSGFINFLGDVIFKPIEFIINLLDKTIDFLFMVKNFYDKYLKEDLEKIRKELWK